MEWPVPGRLQSQEETTERHFIGSPSFILCACSKINGHTCAKNMKRSRSNSEESNCSVEVPIVKRSRQNKEHSLNKLISLLETKDSLIAGLEWFWNA